jgi:GNAT superfamily N-acetyltransferase
MIGLFDMGLLELPSRPCSEGLDDDGAPVHVAQAADLLHLEALLPGQDDHTRRLRAGDLLLYCCDEASLPATGLWLNRATHADAYLGRWSRPTASVWYLNQLYTRPSHRGKGFASQLVRGAQLTAHKTGAHTIRVAVNPDNMPSWHLFINAGSRERGRLRGVRLGRRITLRLATPRHGLAHP